MSFLFLERFQRFGKRGGKTAEVSPVLSIRFPKHSSSTSFGRYFVSAKMTGSVNGTSVPTETSPLLRNSGSEAANGNGNGTVDTGDQQNGATAAAADTDTDENRDGNPEMAKKMHFLLPAVGIGVGSTPARALPRRKAFGSGSGRPLRIRQGLTGAFSRSISALSTSCSPWRRTPRSGASCMR